MIKINKKNVIDVNDWDTLVIETYGKPYNFQQQRGCQERGMFNITIPNDENEEENIEDYGGVTFEEWLKRDPKEPIEGQISKFQLTHFWEREFYPDINIIANDLYKKGLIEAGEYDINIDW